MNSYKNVKFKYVLTNIYVLSLYSVYNNKVDVYIIIFLRLLPFLLGFLLINYFCIDVLLCDDGVDDYRSSNEHEHEHEPAELADTSFSYQPYRPGLQATTEGYRYELNSSPRTTRFELDGVNINRNNDNINRIGNPNNYIPRTREVHLDHNDLNAVNSNKDSIEPRDSEYYRDNYVTMGNKFNRGLYSKADQSLFKKVKSSIKKVVDYVSKDFEETRAKAQIDRDRSREAAIRASESLAPFRRAQAKRRIDSLNYYSSRR